MFPVGSLVRARNRKWVVIPSSDDQLLRLRPLGGVVEEECGILPELERIESDTFELPDPSRIGDARTCGLLRNAVRLSMRSTTGPFRSFAKLAVEPRSYQFVPLLMALRRETVRLLIADDVGIGKTVEALLIARELLDRGEIQRLCILTPAHLCDQWVSEMNEKFHLDAVAVQPGTVSKLEKQCKAGQSLFEVYPFTVVSIDYIKSDRRKHEFLRSCPHFVIVDEAHTCSRTGAQAQQRRYQLLQQLAEDQDRHLLLVTATPHSGISDAFKSLIGLLDPQLAQLPEELAGKENEKHRRRLAEFLIQRKRGDIKNFMDESTAFPQQEEKELSYKLSPDYLTFLNKVLDFTYETVSDPNAPDDFKQKVRWWAALSLLRCVVSSPAAGAAALRTKAIGLMLDSAEEVSALGQDIVLDGSPVDDDQGASDIIPGADTSVEEDPDAIRLRNRLSKLAKEADFLCDAELDHKLKIATKEIKSLVNDGFSPIIFCRFIPTAAYIGEHFRKAMKGVEVAVVTGELHASDRRQQVEELITHPKRILVATDCLSEGINLQEGFDAVFHYDLSWNPTRHEQRNGRVDRFGQPKPLVRSICFYGEDTMIDGAVLRVLIRKHREIKKSLGVSVPVPMDTRSVTDAMVEAIFLNRSDSRQQLVFDEILRESEQAFHGEWEQSKDRERKSQTMFAQKAMDRHLNMVRQQLHDLRRTTGSNADIEAFTIGALQSIGGTVAQQKQAHTYEVNLSEAPKAIRQEIGIDESVHISFSSNPGTGALRLIRSHPFVQGLAGFIAEQALSESPNPIAARCGVMQTDVVETRTTLLLIRSRYHLETTMVSRSKQHELLEECTLCAFESAPDRAKWLTDSGSIESLIQAIPTGNVAPAQQQRFVERVCQGMESILPHLEEVAHLRAKEVLQSHTQVRATLERKKARCEVRPELPVDILGIYVYLPGDNQA